MPRAACCHISPSWSISHRASKSPARRVIARGIAGRSGSEPLTSQWKSLIWKDRRGYQARIDTVQVPVHTINVLSNTDCLEHRPETNTGIYFVRDISFLFPFPSRSPCGPKIDQQSIGWAPVTGRLGPTRRAVCVGLVVVSVPGCSWRRSKAQSKALKPSDRRRVQNRTTVFIDFFFISRLSLAVFNKSQAFAAHRIVGASTDSRCQDLPGVLNRWMCLCESAPVRLVILYGF